MERQWHEVLIQNDEGDRAFSVAAPLLLKSLQIIANTRALQTSLSVACRENELTPARDLNLSFHTECEALQGLHKILHFHLEAVYTSFSHLQCVGVNSHLQDIKQKTIRKENGGGLLKIKDGLISPREMQMDSFLKSQPVFDYHIFRAQFTQLSQFIANGQLFSACEPRIKVLQSQYHLYRAFNGNREDHFHPTLGGGSFRLSPKVDIRQIGSCMSINTLLDFMQNMLIKQPGLILRSRRGISLLNSKEENNNNNKEKERNLKAEYDNFNWIKDGSECKSGVLREEDDENSFINKELEPTLKNLADSFFGPLLPLEERYFTADGLGLLPNYTNTTNPELHKLDSKESCENSTNISKAWPLLRHFLDIYNGNDGELLAQIVKPMLSKILTRDCDILELEFTITGCRIGEIEYIASWCNRSGLIICKNVQFSIRILHQPLSSKKNSNNTNFTVKTLEDVLKNIFEPIWLTLLQPFHYPDLAKFLSRLSSISVSISASADVQEMPVNNDPKFYSLENGIISPDAFFIYHIWRNIQLINCMISAHVFFYTTKGKKMKEENNVLSSKKKEEEEENEIFKFFLPESSLFLHNKPVMLRPIHFRLNTSSTSKNSFIESVIGLLITDEVVNPSEIFNWSPLAYLYYLTQRRIIVTPSRNYNTTYNSSALQEAVSFIVETGLNGSIATIDPLHYHTSDNALYEEFNGIQKSCHLSISDLTELCLHSAESSIREINKRKLLLGGPWEKVRARYNDFTKTQVNYLRLHFRETSISHEMDLLCRKGLKRDSIFTVDREGKESNTSSLPSPISIKNNYNQHYYKQQELKNSITSGIWFLPSWVSIETQRETLWRFFNIPYFNKNKIDGTNVLNYNFIDKQIEFPRIIISGPKSCEKSEFARIIAKSLNKREYYQSFSIHFEPPSVSEISLAKSIDLLMESHPTRNKKKISNNNIDKNKNKNKHHNISSSYYRFSSPLIKEQEIYIPQKFHCVNGVWDVKLSKNENDKTKHYFRLIPSWKEFQSDVRHLREISVQRSFQLNAKRRLEMLECKFNLHTSLTNDDEENSPSQLITPLCEKKGDLYNCIKVDVHCHIACGMTAKELLDFIKEKVTLHYDDVVELEHETKRFITLGKLFTKLRSPNLQNTIINVEELTIANLAVKAGKGTFNRFDEFNGRYNPLGNSKLRSLFLKTDNFMGGRYFAEIIHKVFDRQMKDKHTFSEYRLSIYGRNKNEWDLLSRWFVTYGMSHSTNKWMIQIPRLYFIYRKNGIISNFEEMLTNIFLPLWEASANPKEYPFLNYFLTHISGFDSVDNESEREPDALINIPPKDWTSLENPPFTYWMYYMWANITNLNRYRALHKLSTFTFRPHAGESGNPTHMADTFFLVNGIGHGINLKHSSVLQYLYYLSQIPLAMTPLSNNALFCKYHSNPFVLFFRRGLNVSLGSDGALMFQHTEQPLIEEYSTAINFWNLSQVDVCEIAKNSILMSGFHSHQKKKWLGNLYKLQSAAGNNVRKSRVPQMRCNFRYEVYQEEIAYIEGRAAIEVSGKPVMNAMQEEMYTMDALGLTRKEVMERQLSGKLIDNNNINNINNNKENNSSSKTSNLNLTLKGHNISYTTSNTSYAGPYITAVSRI